MIAMKLDTSLLRSNESKDCNLQATYIPLPCHFASFDETNHFLDFINWKPLYGVEKKKCQTLGDVYKAPREPSPPSPPPRRSHSLFI